MIFLIKFSIPIITLLFCLSNSVSGFQYKNQNCLICHALDNENFSNFKKVDIKKIPLGDALVLGSKNARKKFIVFDDPD